MYLFRSKNCRQVFLICFICVCHFFILLPILCFRRPFSTYFNLFALSKTELKGMVRTTNQKRLKESVQYFTSQTQGENINYYEKIRTSPIFVAVAIITVSRTQGKKDNEGLGYAIQSARGLDKFAKGHHFAQNTFVFVCNVDAKPANHKDAMFLRDYLPFVERYGSSSFKMADFQLPDKNTTYREKTHKKSKEKETYDYSYCLKVAKSLKPEYILMVEDDALPHEDLGDVLHYSLHTHIVHTSSQGVRKRDFVYLKLYYPEKWQGYAYEIYRILELVSVGYVGGGIYLLFVFAFLKTSRSKTVLLLGHFIIGFLLFVVTAELVGRQNMMELRRLSKYFYQFRPSPGCCTPAMLFPSAIVDPVISHITMVSSKLNTDLALADFVKHSNIPAFQLEPNLFHHIGMKTSLDKGDKSPEQFLF